jgi:hypothetical protein
VPVAILILAVVLTSCAHSAHRGREAARAGGPAYILLASPEGDTYPSEVVQVSWLGTGTVPGASIMTRLDAQGRLDLRGIPREVWGDVLITLLPSDGGLYLATPDGKGGAYFMHDYHSLAPGGRVRGAPPSKLDRRSSRQGDGASPGPVRGAAQGRHLGDCVQVGPGTAYADDGK